jgi:hypothetical protein
MNTNLKIGLVIILTGFFLSSLVLAGCNPSLISTPTYDVPTKIPITQTPLPTKIPQPEITIKTGERYFRVNRVPQIIFSRNIAGWYPIDYNTMLEMMPTGGSRLARIAVSSIVMGGTGYTSSGEVDEQWAQRWDKVFKKAESEGISVMVSFTGWFDYTRHDFSEWDWNKNPMNAVNGGPASNTHELFQKDSKTQKIFLQWMKTLVTRWQGYKAIVIWEPYSEVNLAEGLTEEEAIYFVEQSAKVIHEADPQKRPITNSLADFGDWKKFYNSPGIDFINIHPYPGSGQLDAKILNDVPALLTTYKKPVMIGESGLDSAVPSEKSLTLAKNAITGLRHAIWAGLVSGSMNARGLWWEDGNGIYFPELSWPYLKNLNEIELPVHLFSQSLDMTGYEPIDSTFSAKLTGGALGNNTTIIGWFRDSQSEPPDWKTDSIIDGQIVTLSVPGDDAVWKVDFIDTKTGTDVVASSKAAGQGGNITLSLPAFQNDIAFKMELMAGEKPVQVPSEPVKTISVTKPETVKAIEGKWTGIISGENSGFSNRIDLEIYSGCRVGQVCGKVTTPGSCMGELLFKKSKDGQYVFMEQNMKGKDCLSGGIETLQLQSDDSLSFRFNLTPPNGSELRSKGILKRP